MRRVSLREDEVLEGDGAVRLAPHPTVGHRPDQKQREKLINLIIINTSVLFSDTTKNGGLKKRDFDGYMVFEDPKGWEKVATKSNNY